MAVSEIWTLFSMNHFMEGVYSFFSQQGDSASKEGFNFKNRIVYLFFLFFDLKII